MKGRETKASPKADLLVCFPSRAHLTLMPKPICSPGRHPEPNKRHHNNHRHHHHLKKSSTTRSCGQASPLLWAKTKSMGSEIAEPTSPKVTCAGQIKVGPTTTACRSWQSVIEKIEKIHNHNEKKQKKIPNWAHCLSFKKEAMQLLACFRGMRFDLGCFGTFAEANIATEEEEEDQYDYEEGCRGTRMVVEESENETSTVFSKWFMVLQENQSSNVAHKEGTKDKDNMEATNDGSNEEAEEHNVPPPNALLLMRCRSAPVRSLFKEKEEGKNEEQGKEENEHREEGKVKEKAAANNNKGKSLKSLMEENRKKEKSMLVMRYDSDFYNISSSGIAQQTWIVGGLRDPL